LTISRTFPLQKLSFFTEIVFSTSHIREFVLESRYFMSCYIISNKTLHQLNIQQFLLQ